MARAAVSNHPDADSARHPHLALAAGVSAASAVSILLYKFPPESYGFYPPCPFHALTGLLCPGCGATRALAALVHGNLAEAMHSNGLFVVLLPFLLVYLAIAYLRSILGLRSMPLPTPAVAALLAISIGFGVVRNLV